MASLIEPGRTCPACKGAVSEGAAFCRHCGASLTRTRKWPIIAAAIGVVSLAGIGASWFLASDPETVPDIMLEERKLATLPAGFRITRQPWVAFSDGGRRVAYLVAEHGSYTLFRNGERVAGEVSDFAVSHDGRRLAYVTSRMDVLRRRFSVVVDGSRGPEFDRIWGLQFSRDGQRVGYLAHAEDKQSLIVDGAVAGAHEAIGEFVLGSAPGGKVAYTVAQGGKSFVVVNGQRLRPYDSVTHLSISGDGSQIAYGACEQQRCFVVAGQQHGQEYGWVSLIGLSRDGRRIGYWASQQQGEGFVVVGDHEGEPIRNASAWGAPQFSPDGGRYWYVSGIPQKGMFVVADGVRGPLFADVGAAVFSPDGRQLAYPARPRDGKWLIAVGEQQSPGADFTIDAAFSRDGRKVGYGALIGTELWWKIMDVGTLPPTTAAGARSAASPPFNDRTVRSRLVRDFQGNVYGVAAARGLLAAKSLGAEMGVFVVDAATGESRGHYPDGLPIALSPDGRLLAIGGPSGVSVWNTADRARVASFAADVSGGVAFAETAEQIIAWDGDGAPSWWDIATGTRAQPGKRLERPTLKRLVSPDGRLEVRIGEYDQVTGRSPLTFVDSQTGRTLGVVGAPDGVLGAAAFAADGTALVFGGIDGRVHLVTFPPSAP